MFIPHKLEELFQVNVAKKHASLPRQLKAELTLKIAVIAQRAQEIYREKLVFQNSDLTIPPLKERIKGVKSASEFDKLLVDCG